MVENAAESKIGEFTGVQISKRVHRKLQFLCLYLKQPLGMTTNNVMEDWVDKTAEAVGFVFPKEDGT